MLTPYEKLIIVSKAPVAKAPVAKAPVDGN